MAGVVSGGSKLRPEEAKKFFQDQAPPLFQGLDVHPPAPPTPLAISQSGTGCVSHGEGKPYI